jgi:hypothetical protein
MSLLETSSTTVPARHSNSGSVHSFPEFPSQAYLGVLADFAELYSQFYESPKEFFYFAALLQMSIVLCGRVRANFGSLSTQPRLYGLKVGPIGTSKKTTADAFAQAFVERALSTASNPDDEIFGLPISTEEWRFILPGAGSGEGVVSALQQNKRVLLLYDEFERFAKKVSVEGSVLGTAVNELFEKTTYANATKNNVANLSDVYLALSANMPLEQFESTSGASKMLELGLWSRLIFVIGDRRHEVLRVCDPPEEEVSALVARLSNHLKALKTSGQNGGSPARPEREIRILLSDAARLQWDEYGTVIGYGADTTRLDTIGMRLMSILAFTSGKHEIDTEVVRAVMAFLEYQKTIRATYKISLAETIDAKAEAAIMRCVNRSAASGELISEREIRRGTSVEKQYGLRVFNEALQRLCNGGRLRKEPGQFGKSCRYGLGDESD